jgi:hypothetical protein
MTDAPKWEGRTNVGFSAPEAKHYPMLPDNPCLNMTDDELKAYIRMRYKEFEERHKL